MTREETKELFEMMDMLFPMFTKNVSDSQLAMRLDLWSAALADDEWDAIRLGFTNFVKTDTSGFPPSIGQLRSATVSLAEDDYDDTEEAMADLRAAVSRSAYGSEHQYYLLSDTLQAAVGSPKNLRAWSQLEEDEFETITLSQVRRSYRTIREREKQIAKMRPIDQARMRKIQANLERVYAINRDMERLPFEEREDE